MITLLIVNIVKNGGDNLNEVTFEEIFNYVLYPKKVPFSMIFNNMSHGEFLLIAAFIKYEETNPGKNITVNELASELAVSIPAVSRMLRNMEAKNLIKRETDKECRRNTIVLITDEGKQLFRTNKDKIKHIVSKIVENFSEQELNLMFNVSRKIENILEKEIKYIHNNI